MSAPTENPAGTGYAPEALRAALLSCLTARGSRPWDSFGGASDRLHEINKIAVAALTLDQTRPEVEGAREPFPSSKSSS